MQLFSVDQDISVARTLNTDFYLDSRVYPTIMEKIFSRSWQLAGDQAFVQHTGECFPFTLLPGSLEEPLLLTRDKFGITHCLSNVCTHRGNILVNEHCNQPHLRCRYHGRLFNLDGEFHSMPEFKEVKDFPDRTDSLSKLPLASWHSLLFTSLNPLVDFATLMGDMIQRLHWLPLEQFTIRPELSMKFDVDANWALYCENYLEGFHIPFVHAGLNSVIDFGSYTTELFNYSNLQLALAKNDQLNFDLPSTSVDHGKRVAAFYFFVFPNMMFNFYPWGLSVNIVEPKSIDKTTVRFLYYVWKNDIFGPGAGSDLDTVEKEDEEVVNAVQKGIRSRFYRHGRYSVTREQGTHHFHRILGEFMSK